MSEIKKNQNLREQPFKDRPCEQVPIVIPSHAPPIVAGFFGNRKPGFNNGQAVTLCTVMRQKVDMCCMMTHAERVRQNPQSQKNMETGRQLYITRFKTKLTPNPKLEVEL